MFGTPGLGHRSERRLINSQQLYLSADPWIWSWNLWIMGENVHSDVHSPNLMFTPISLRESTPKVIPQQFYAPATRSARKTRGERADLGQKFQRLKFCEGIVAMRHLDLKMCPKSMANKDKKRVFFLRGEKKQLYF